MLGEAVARAARPPRVRLQASTATIYAHRYAAANDEVTGMLGGGKPDVPDTWRFSIDVAISAKRGGGPAATPDPAAVPSRLQGEELSDGKS